MRNLLPNQSLKAQRKSTYIPHQFVPLIIAPSAFQTNDWFIPTIITAMVIILILIVIIVVLLYIIRRQATNKDEQPRSQSASPAPAVQSNVSTLPSMPKVDSEHEQTAQSLPQAKKDDDQTDPSLQRKHPSGEATVQTHPISGQRPENIAWQIAGLTDVGLKREINEDRFVMLEAATTDQTPCGLYIVADGMGGHEHGEVASKLTIDTIQARFDQTTFANNDYEGWMKEAINAANSTVIAHQSNGAEGGLKMGSTLVMALVVGNKAYIANVGDSRAYQLNQETISQISVDHSLVERLIQLGQITREEARTHNQRNVIYSTIGDPKAKLQIGFYQVTLQPGDRLLLCSDGLTGMLTDEQLLNINHSTQALDEACKILIKAANASGGEDNITAILVEMNGSS